MRNIVYCDIDNTIWDLQAELVRLSAELVGSSFLEANADYSRWSWPSDVLSPETASKVFDGALDPDKVMDREVFPHFVESISSLHDNLGFEIRFLSHNPNPSAIQGRINGWLGTLLDIPFAANVVESSVDKLHYIRESNAGNYGGMSVLIDDKPSTLADAYFSGSAIPICKEGEWNADVLNYYDIMSFTDWRDVPEMVEALQKYNRRERHWV